MPGRSIGLLEAVPKLGKGFVEQSSNSSSGHSIFSPYMSRDRWPNQKFSQGRQVGIDLAIVDLDTPKVFAWPST